MIYFLIISASVAWALIALFSPWFNHLDEIEKIFKPHLVKSNTLMRVYTDEGIYDIDNDNNTILILEPHDSKIEIIKGYFDNFNLIIDSSYFNKNIVNNSDGIVGNCYSYALAHHPILFVRMGLSDFLDHPPVLGFLLDYHTRLMS